MLIPPEEYEKKQWFVMRDLKRSNALNPAWKSLREKGFDTFTPMQWRLSTVNGRRMRKYVPFITDLLFVNSSMARLDPEVRRNDTLQYRYVKNCGGRPMTVRSTEMDRFIHAVEHSEKVEYFLPEEISGSQIGKKVRIIGGWLNGYEGNLLSVKGSKYKRLIVEIPDLVFATIEVQPEYIQFI